MNQPIRVNDLFIDGSLAVWRVFECRPFGVVELVRDDRAMMLSTTKQQLRKAWKRWEFQPNV